MCLIYRWTFVNAEGVSDTTLDTGNCKKCDWYMVRHWPLPGMCLIYRWTLANAEDVFDTGHWPLPEMWLIYGWTLITARCVWYIAGHWPMPKTCLMLDIGHCQKCDWYMVGHWSLPDVSDRSLDTGQCRRGVWYTLGNWPILQMCLIYRWKLASARDVPDIPFDTGHC